MSVDDTIDYALNALDKLFCVFSDLDAESERLVRGISKAKARSIHQLTNCRPAADIC